MCSRNHFFNFLAMSNKLLLHICSVDCKWAQWSSCSQKCGPGNKTRTIEVPAKNGGQECPGNNTESCKEKECPGMEITDKFVLIFFKFWVTNYYIQLIANGHPGPVVVRTVVQEPEKERLMSQQNMVAKNVQAMKKRVAKTESAQVSKLPIHFFSGFE